MDTGGSIWGVGTWWSKLKKSLWLSLVQRLFMQFEMWYHMFLRGNVIWCGFVFVSNHFLPTGKVLYSVVICLQFRLWFRNSAILLVKITHWLSCHASENHAFWNRTFEFRESHVSWWCRGWAALGFPTPSSSYCPPPQPLLTWPYHVLFPTSVVSVPPPSNLQNHYILQKRKWHPQGVQDRGSAILYVHVHWNIN